MTFLIVLILLLFVAGIIFYNRLIRHRNLVNEAWAGIDVQLLKRAELVPNLVQTVKAYVKHESSVFEDVAKIRGQAESGNDEPVSSRAKNETALSRSLTRLFALAEDYPDLKASEGFQQLHRSLVDIENDLQFARRYYNGASRDNNNAVQSFPSNIVAKIFDFSEAEFFEIELASQRAVPDVAL